jgi:hypothetical protein
MIHEQVKPLQSKIKKTLQSLLKEIDELDDAYADTIDVLEDENKTSRAESYSEKQNKLLDLDFAIKEYLGID